MEEKEVKKDDSLLPDTFIVHNDLLINYTDEDSNNDLIIPISSVPPILKKSIRFHDEEIQMRVTNIPPSYPISEIDDFDFYEDTDTSQNEDNPNEGNQDIVIENTIKDNNRETESNEPKFLLKRICSFPASETNESETINENNNLNSSKSSSNPKKN